MYGNVLPAVSSVTGVAGVAVLPNTGSTRVLFIAAATMLVVGVVSFATSSAVAIKRRASKA